MKRSAWIAAAAVGAAAGVGLLTACGSSGSQSSDSKAPSPKSSVSSTMPSMSAMPPSGSKTSKTGTAIIIKNFSYTVPASVAPKAKITVTNQDGVEHSVTLKSVHIDVVVQPGDKRTFNAPNKAATYNITCDFHSFMHAKLVVK